MEEELSSHTQHRADDLQRSGLSHAKAGRRARIEFGGRIRFREECRQALAGNFIETSIQDVRFSLRVLRKSPGFVLVAIVTLALAIGASAVVFGVLNAMILRPLNVPQAESLYAIQHGNEASFYQSYADYLDQRDRNRSFDGLAAYGIAEVGLDLDGNVSNSRGDGRERQLLGRIKGSYFGSTPPTSTAPTARLSRARLRLLAQPFPR